MWCFQASLYFWQQMLQSKVVTRRTCWVLGRELCDKGLALKEDTLPLALEGVNSLSPYILLLLPLVIPPSTKSCESGGCCRFCTLLMASKCTKDLLKPSLSSPVCKASTSESCLGKSDNNPGNCAKSAKNRQFTSEYELLMKLNVVWFG